MGGRYYLMSAMTVGDEMMFEAFEGQHSMICSIECSHWLL